MKPETRGLVGSRLHTMASFLDFLDQERGEHNYIFGLKCMEALLLEEDVPGEDHQGTPKSKLAFSKI